MPTRHSFSKSFYPRWVIEVYKDIMDFSELTFIMFRINTARSCVTQTMAVSSTHPTWPVHFQTWSSFLWCVTRALSSTRTCCPIESLRTIRSKRCSPTKSTRSGSSLWTSCTHSAWQTSAANHAYQFVSFTFLPDQEFSWVFYKYICNPGFCFRFWGIGHKTRWYF